LKRLKSSLFLLFVFSAIACAQYSKEKDYVRFLFYNVENYFDCEDDTLKRDEDFLPEGKKHWTKSRLYSKTNNICKAIVAVGGWQAPGIIGLAEIENAHVLHILSRYSLLDNLNYRFIHKESPDRRGVDVALMFLPEVFRPVDTSFFQINFPDKPEKKTRDLLFVKGIVKDIDTLSVFICHWSSRLGGKKASAWKRNYVAGLIREKVDSLLAINPDSKIIIAGDFNDEPDDESVIQYLKACQLSDTTKHDDLINLSHTQEGKGTHKYNGIWGILDHIIVSKPILTSQNGLNVRPDAYRIFEAGFLLIPDKKFLGTKPLRTFNGFHYQDGFSDHLPVYIDLTF